MKPNHSKFVNALASTEEAFILYEGLRHMPETFTNPKFKDLDIRVDPYALRARIARRLRIAKRARQLLTRSSKIIIGEYKSRGASSFEHQPEETREALRTHLGLGPNNDDPKSLQESANEVIADLNFMIESYQHTINMINRDHL